MKKFLITLGLVFGILFFLTGCEDGDRTLSPVIEEPTLHFDREGEYDLSEYLVPKSEQINFYELSEYIDSTGKRSYSDADKNTSYYSLKYLKPEANKTEEFQNDVLEKVFDVYADRISEYISEDNRTIEIVKKASINDYIIIDELNIDEEDNSRDFNMSCQVFEYFPTYQTHKNVLQISCSIRDDEYFSSSSGTIEVNTIKSGTHNMWFAKEIGMVRSVKDICTKGTFNASSEESCLKEVRELRLSDPI